MTVDANIHSYRIYKQVLVLKIEDLLVEKQQKMGNRKQRELILLNQCFYTQVLISQPNKCSSSEVAHQEDIKEY